MAFIRLKKIKGKEYAYQVESTWDKTNHGPQQTVKNYLGACVRLSDVDVPSVDIDGTFVEEVTALVRQHLTLNGFVNEKNTTDGKSCVMIRDRISVDLERCTITRRGRACVLKMWDGYMCDKTLERVIHFKPQGYEEEAGEDLAHALRNAGLKVSPEVFVRLFEKVYKITNI